MLTAKQAVTNLVSSFVTRQASRSDSRRDFRNPPWPQSLDDFRYAKSTETL
ncbi:hypothetical protein Mal33_10180 [Rosistilla oblonga]|uniref:Uncharacterized protein n=1 Tax=Rosistilla oblonga TaxID=2527990 RepID=A0A518IPQ8_9BACT|nr:hypothetical protein Mal33_10180 [Rosistilla oblonga]